MGKGGGKTETVQNSFPPEILNAITGNMNVANNIASKPYPGYYDYSKPFNADNYYAQNQDVAQSYQSYLKGFQPTAGGAETGAFDPATYLKANPSVQAGWDANTDGTRNGFNSLNDYATFHYNNVGKSQGMASGSPTTPAVTTPMSAADYALNHWNTSGQTEGRSGGYNLKDLVAGFSPDQQAAFGMARGIAGTSTPDMGYWTTQQAGGIANGADYGQTLAKAAGDQASTRDYGYGVASSLGSYTPQQVAAERIAAERVAAQSLDGKDLSGYMNPFTDAVVDRTLADISRQGEQAGNTARARAAAAGAFGGSRSALLEAETARGYADAGATASANLRNAGYTQAQNVATSDADRALRADTSNQSASLQAAQANQDAALRAALANQSADLSGAQLRLGAAGQMAQSGTAQTNALLGSAGQLANSNNAQVNNMLGSATGMQNAAGAAQTYDINKLNTLLGTGGMQQQQNQTQMDSQYEQYLRAIGYPVEMLKVRQIPLTGALPSTSTSTGSGGGSVANTLGAVGSAASGVAGLASLFALSDRRVKTDITPVGKLDNGLTVYRFRYISGGPMQLGLMAQEVEQVHPEAVAETPDGVKMVNYELATEAA